jgi:predicted PurR-regulated permease PerM
VIATKDTFFYFLVAAAAIWLIYQLSPVLSPFLVSAFLAYLGDPLVDRLEARRCPRGLAVALLYLVMALVLALAVLFLVPLLNHQVVILVGKIPALISFAQSHLVAKINALGGDLPALNIESVRQAVMAHWQQVGNVAGNVLGEVSRSGLAIATFLAYLLLVPVVTFYLLRDWDHLMAHCRRLLPRRAEATIMTLIQECDRVLAEFLRGQLLVMLSLGTIYTCGLWLIGLDLSLLIGMGAGLLSFIPYLGCASGIVAAGIAAYAQFHDVTHLLMVLAVFGAGQTLDGVYLSPNLVGERIGLHPVAVIFAVMAGGQLFGFFGVLLALPVSAMIVVLARHGLAYYYGSGLYGAAAEAAEGEAKAAEAAAAIAAEGGPGP